MYKFIETKVRCDTYGARVFKSPISVRTNETETTASKQKLRLVRMYENRITKQIKIR